MQAEITELQDEKSHILQNPQREVCTQTKERKLSSNSLVMKHLDKILAIILLIFMILFFLESSIKSNPLPNRVNNSTQRGQFINQNSLNYTNHRDHLNIQSTLDKNQSQLGVLKAQKAAMPTGLTQEENQNTTYGEKIALHTKRGQILKKYKGQAHLQYLELAQYNLQLPNQSSAKRQALFDEEKRRLEDRYHMSEFPQELSLCVVVYASGNGKPYSHEYVLNSIFWQEYQNYAVVYVADGHLSSEVEIIKQFLTKKESGKSIIFVWNSEKQFFLKSVLQASRDHCSKKKVTTLIDGDDQLLGGQVFRLLNTFYKRYKVNLVYSNFVEFHQDRETLRLGFSSEYSENQKRMNSYRRVGQKFGSLKSFKTKLLDFIKEDDFKDSSGEYQKYAGDYALMYPLLELSCAELRYLPEFNYLYYGYEVSPTFGPQQIRSGRSIKEKKPYECFQKYV